MLAAQVDAVNCSQMPLQLRICMWPPAAMRFEPQMLQVGAKKAMSLAQQQGIPFVPVHHMEAHALTVRQGQVRLAGQSYQHHSPRHPEWSAP